MTARLTKFRMYVARRIPIRMARIICMFLTPQFIIYMVMGIINTGILIITASLLDMLRVKFIIQFTDLNIFIEKVRLTFILGYITSIITSFLLNCKITFHEKPTWHKFIKFPISYIPNFFFQYLMVFIFTALNWNHTIAYICAAIIGTPLTFAAMKLIVFQKKRNRKKEI